MKRRRVATLTSLLERGLESKGARLNNGGARSYLYPTLTCGRRRGLGGRGGCGRLQLRDVSHPKPMPPRQPARTGSLRLYPQVSEI
jgi:hypothetical protein